MGLGVKCPPFPGTGTTGTKPQTTEMTTQPLSPQHKSIQAIPSSHTRTLRPPRVGIHTPGNAPSLWRHSTCWLCPYPSLPSLMGSFNQSPVIRCLLFFSQMLHLGLPSCFPEGFPGASTEVLPQGCQSEAGQDQGGLINQAKVLSNILITV